MRNQVNIHSSTSRESLRKHIRENTKIYENKVNLILQKMNNCIVALIKNNCPLSSNLTKINKQIQFSENISHFVKEVPLLYTTYRYI